MEGVIVDGVFHASWLGIPIGIVHAIIAGVIAIIIAMINRTKAEVKLTKQLIEDVKVSVDESKVTVEEIRATGEDIHTLVNSNMGVQLECTAMALKQVVTLLELSPTATPAKIAVAIAAADKADQLLALHNKQQAIVDAGLITPTPRKKVSDE